jgi:hypothetical protein
MKVGLLMHCIFLEIYLHSGFEQEDDDFRAEASSAPDVVVFSDPTANPIAPSTTMNFDKKAFMASQLSNVLVNPILIPELQSSKVSKLSEIIENTGHAADASEDAINEQ